MTEFDGSSGMALRDLYAARNNYRINVNDAGHNLLDTLYVDRKYGLINENSEPVVLLTDEEGTSLDNFRPLAPGVSAANFVVRAFNRLKDDYSSLVRAGAFSWPPFINTLIPQSGYKNFDDLYEEFQPEVVEFYLGLIRDQDRISIIRNFDDFNSAMDLVMRENLKYMPITRSGFLLSPRCPLAVSGLQIELAKMNYDFDGDKAELLRSKDFACFVKKCEEYGFVVDKNAPWRIVADINSQPMITEIKKYHDGATQYDILNRFYRTKVHYDDIYSLQAFYYQVYKLFVDEAPTADIIVRDPLNDRVNREIIVRSRDLLEGVYIPSDEFWISLLLRVRLIELDHHESQLEEILREVLDIHRFYGRLYYDAMKMACGAIGKICSEIIEEKYRNNISLSIDRQESDNDETVTDEALEQNSEEVPTNSPQKKTTMESGHDHEYELDEDGNGWTSYAYHPDHEGIKHRHRVESGVVQVAQSSCYPVCVSRYGFTGVGPHIHRIIN